MKGRRIIQNVALVHDKFYTPSSAWKVFVGFAMLVALTGGGSRDDIASLVILRPVACLVIGYGILASRESELKRFATAYYFLVALGIFFMLQLLPLPPSLWKSLPGRDFYMEVALATNTEQVWRPLSLSPSKTLNSLFSLSIPLAAVSTYAALTADDRERALLLIVLYAILNAVIGMFQLTGSFGQAFYFYRITSDLSPVGLFANRNHFAVMLAATLPLMAAFMCSSQTKRWYSKFGRRPLVLAHALFFVVLVAFSIMIVISGSRAGVGCLAVSVVGSTYILRLIQVHDQTSVLKHKVKKYGVWQYSWSIPLVLVLVAGLATFAGGRAVALDRLFSGNTNTTRFDVLPTILEMASAFFPVGAGMGAFSTSYYRFERDEFLDALYLNHAHNDWLQVVVEGGAIAAAFLSFALIFVMRRLFKLLSHSMLPFHERCIQLGLIGLVVIIMLASVVDYPARTPSVMWVLTISLIALLAGTAKGTNHRSNTPRISRR